MFRLLKPLMFALVTALLMSCVPAFAAPGAAVNPEKHPVVKAAAVEQAAHQVVFNFVFEAPALPGLENQVPKPKVYGLHKYFGMIVGSDISHRYRTADIIFRNNPYHFYLHLPSLITA